MRTAKFFVALAIAAIAVFHHPAQVQAQTPTRTQTGQQAKEPLLDILTSELEYSFDKLQSGDSPPYYIAFRVTDSRSRVVNASFGVLTSTTRNQNHNNYSRDFKSHIRLGSPDFDNFHDNFQGGSGGSVRLPVGEENPDAIRQAIWLNVESSYKGTVMELERLRAADLVRTARDDSAPDWSSAPVETYYEAPLSKAEMAFDYDDMERRVKAYSAIFRDHPDFLSGSASINFGMERRYFVSTEGASVTQNIRACRLMISASVRTDDGMDLPLYNSYFAFSPEGLPSDEQVLADTRQLAATLAAMKSAPVVDPYTGPAILSGEASGVFFHEIFGHRIEGQRMKSDSDGQTFKKMVGQSVLPRHFSVYDDPTLERFEKADLYGHYLYDDQGVKARRVDVVKDGLLHEFLMTRTPIDEFGSSNGHARAMGSLDPVSRQSNLVVSTSRPMTDKQLRDELIKEAKAQGREFGLFFKEVTGGFTQTGRYSPNSFNVTPLEVYKIYIDGRPDELVRGVDLIGTPLSMFESIAEAGGTTEIFTGVCGAESGSVPVTAVSPQVLVKKVEVQRKAKSSNIQPILDRPDIDTDTAKKGKATKNNDETIFRAMQAELDRNMKELKMDNAQAPFLISYIYNDVRSMGVAASLGELTSSNYNPGSHINSVKVLLGDYTMTDELNYDFYNAGSSAMEIDEWMIKREFWMASDNRYKQAVTNMVQKRASRQKNVRPPEEAALPDLLPVEPVEKFVENPRFEFDREKWERRVKELSAVFAEYPSLYNSRVSMTAEDRTCYVLSSEGVKMRQPISLAGITVGASVRFPADGSSTTQSLYITATSDLTLPSQDSLLRFVRDFAQKLSDTAVAPKFEGYYIGPVLFVGKSVFPIFSNNLLAANGNRLLARRDGENQTGAKTPDRFEKRIGQRVLDSRLSVINHSTMRSWNGTPLLGYYEIDADGVTPPASLTLIENGMLRAQLNGRIPTVGAPASTGSNRFGGYNISSTLHGTLEVTASEGRSVSELEKELLALAAADGLDHAYIIEGFGFSLVWKVDVATGRRTLMRGVEWRGIDMTKLRRIAGISETSEMHNYTANGIPVSMIYPSAMLLQDVEIGARETKGEKPLPIINPLERDED